MIDPQREIFKSLDGYNEDLYAYLLDMGYYYHDVRRLSFEMWELNIGRRNSFSARTCSFIRDCLGSIVLRNKSKEEDIEQPKVRCVRI